MEYIGKVYMLSTISLCIISSAASSGEFKFLVEYQHFNSSGCCLGRTAIYLSTWDYCYTVGITIYYCSLTFITA